MSDKEFKEWARGLPAWAPRQHTESIEDGKVVVTWNVGGVIKSLQMSTQSFANHSNLVVGEMVQDMVHNLPKENAK